MSHNPTLNKFMMRISEHPLLTPEEERNATRDQLVVSNLRFVVHIARRYCRSDEELLDTIQDGCVGLIIAAERYDPERGKFTVCANFYIRNAIREARMTTSRMVRLPRPVQARIGDIDRMSIEGSSADEIATALDLPIKGVRAAMSQTFESTETQPEQESSETDPELLCDREMALVLAGRKLTQKQRRVIEGRLQGYTSAELAEQMGVTRQAVELNEKAAIERLR